MQIPGNTDNEPCLGDIDEILIRVEPLDARVSDLDNLLPESEREKGALAALVELQQIQIDELEGRVRRDSPNSSRQPTP